MNLKIKIICVFSIFSIFFIGCTEEVRVVNNDIVVYEEQNIKITLIDIVDNRCPVNVNCVWKGNAEVNLRITKKNKTEDFVLNTAGYINDTMSFPTNVTIFDLTIELLNVVPFPEEGVSYSTDDYTVKISVTN